MQIWRWMGEIGLFRIIFVWCVIVPFGFLFLWQKMGGQPYNWGILSVSAVLFLLLHRKRKDFLFLYKQVSRPQWLYFGEYCFYSCFIIGCLLFHEEYTPLLCYILVLLGIAFVPPLSTAVCTYTVFLRPVPVTCFEWRCGIRQNVLSLWLCLFLMMGGIFFWGIAIAAFVFFTLLVLSFYLENEPRNVLEATALTPSLFLNRKLIRHTGYFALALLPFCCIAFIHYSYWVYTLSAYFAALNLFVFGILMKYTYYRPNTYSTVRSLIISAVGLLSLLLPFAGIVFVANLFLYYSALKNLDTYFYAFD
jgi:hypothetical protein